ncbi:2,3-dihydroxybenzoate-AMP ligase [Bradyrhizobium sp. SK17]|jgi:2,3-dihydroxybenzoate-AMP ligase|uniref:(2,3-dihydroxybenzoyl)adenylate synthase n=1 Tax=Bradyrhizobium sp. SK17 TaxID=2057741 RepID=UPI000C312E57|nr:AMP-binding protein [Bradyrhizobium sp. SK17]AUC95632.1 2,3-dihydroxybenzoate-AMP ligase [Bradyrhizobium sp. SK17]
MSDATSPLRTVLLPDMRYPDAVRARYRQRGYWDEETLPDIVRAWAIRHGGRTALLTARDDWDFTTLVARADRFGRHLAGRGVVAGEAVVLQHHNDTDFVVALLALLLLGAVPVLALPAHQQREVTHVAELATAVGYLGTEQAGIDTAVLRSAVSSLRFSLLGSPNRRFADWPDDGTGPLPRPVVSPEDVALLLLSGGTTGMPKLIARTHADYIYNFRASAELCAVTAEDRYLAALPMAHNFPLGCPGILGTLDRGGAVIVPPSSAAEEAFESIAGHRATLTALVPSLAALWLEASEWEQPDLSSLRLLQVGGAKLDAVAADRLASAFPCRLQQVFGMAEGLLNFTRLDDAPEVIAATQGRPLCDADEVRIVDERGRDVPAGEIGELLVRGPYTIRGYYRAADYNRHAFTSDGFYRSGDRVRRLASGHLIVEGRIKDVINRHGESIAADEIETCLRDHPAVRDAAVFADPQAGHDEAVHAVVICDDRDLTLNDIRAFFTRQRVAAYKWPDKLSHVERFPLTPIGKVDKRQLATILRESVT